MRSGLAKFGRVTRYNRDRPSQSRYGLVKSSRIRCSNVPVLQNVKITYTAYSGIRLSPALPQSSPTPSLNKAAINSMPSQQVLHAKILVEAVLTVIVICNRYHDGVHPERALDHNQR